MDTRRDIVVLSPQITQVLRAEQSDPSSVVFDQVVDALTAHFAKIADYTDADFVMPVLTLFLFQTAPAWVITENGYTRVIVHGEGYAIDVIIQTPVTTTTLQEI